MRKKTSAKAEVISASDKTSEEKTANTGNVKSVSETKTQVKVETKSLEKEAKGELPKDVLKEEVEVKSILPTKETFEKAVKETTEQLAEKVKRQKEKDKLRAMYEQGTV